MHNVPRPLRVLLIIVLLLAIVAGASWARLRSEAAQGALSASGTMEAEETSLAFDSGGRLSEMLVGEGSTVAAGAVLVRLDDSALAAQIAEAQAALDVAKANLGRLKAGARPEEVAAARAALSQTIATRDGARRAWDSAVQSRDTAQDLNARIGGSQAQLEAARAQVGQARAALESARVQRDHHPDQAIYAFQVRAAEEGVLAAQARVQRAEAEMASLTDMLARPLLAQVQVDAAQAAYFAAAAAVEVAQARVDALVAGPTPWELATAEAAVNQAEAALRVLQVQRDRLTLVSPLDGVVTGRAFGKGELVAAGAPVLTIADTTRLHLRVFVEEDRVGLVRLGQAARVSVDAFPGRQFDGVVSYISPRAEFTPKNVQTERERVTTVFAVRIRVANPDLSLKPGMPADAQFVR
jgi:multidrug efflux pump subunit AcrA (membrane-fusion protein)